MIMFCWNCLYIISNFSSWLGKIHILRQLWKSNAKSSEIAKIFVVKSSEWKLLVFIIWFVINCTYLFKYSFTCICCLKCSVSVLISLARLFSEKTRGIVIASSSCSCRVVRRRRAKTLTFYSTIKVLPPTTLKLHMLMHLNEFYMPHQFLGH